MNWHRAPAYAEASDFARRSRLRPTKSADKAGLRAQRKASCPSLSNQLYCSLQISAITLT